MLRSTAVLHILSSYSALSKSQWCLHPFLQLSHAWKCFKHCRNLTLVLNQLFCKTLWCISLLWSVRNPKGGTHENRNRCFQTVTAVLLIGTLAKQCHMCHCFLLSPRNTSRKIENANLIFSPAYSCFTGGCLSCPSEWILFRSIYRQRIFSRTTDTGTQVLSKNKTKQSQMQWNEQLKDRKVTYVLLCLAPTGWHSNRFLILLYSAERLEDICHFSTLTVHFLVCLDLCHNLNGI